MEKQTPDENERIDVLQHFQQVTDSLIAFLRNAKESIEVCVDPASVFVIVSFPPYLQGCLDAKQRGVAIKIVTEITTENVDYCKQMMKFAEVRHIDGIKGNFGVQRQSISHLQYYKKKSLQPKSSTVTPEK